jgi:predicted RNA-binding Zn-ribbon protein involved in translation (DUF1610 family)
MSDGIDQENEVTIRCPECGDEITVVIEKTHHDCQEEVSYRTGERRW